MLCFQDDRKARERKRISTDSVLEFRRRQSALESNNPAHASIILRSSIFRRHFRPSSLQPHDYTKTNRKKIKMKFIFLTNFLLEKAFDDDLQTKFIRNDSCLTPATDSDSPLLIEEYHQLFRIIMLHELEDTREMV